MSRLESCAHCGGLRAIRNPTGACDHLCWPDNLTAEARKANGLEAGNALDGVAREFLGAACALLDWARKNTDVPDELLAEWSAAEKPLRDALGSMDN